MVRSCGTDKQGAAFFPPPLLLRQEPRGEQGECLVVMPSFPSANLILRQARVALGPPKTLFDPVFDGTANK
jgi:hypothetical protein